MISDYLPKDPTAYLRDELSLRQARRPHYSLRAFARDLEMSPGALSDFLSGRKGLSRERAVWIGKKLRLSEGQIEHFWDLIEEKLARSESARRAARARLAARAIDDEGHIRVEEFRLIADWYHFPILELLGLDSQRPSLEQIARILNISESEVKAGVARLKELKLIDENLKPTGHETIAGAEGRQRAFQHYHQGFLEMQARAAAQVALDDRETLSFTVGINSDEWGLMRVELQKAVVQVLNKYASSPKPKDQVICCSMQALQLLRTTQINGDGGVSQ